jgi:hypothetical protein
MESCIANRLNSLSVLFCNLEKKVNDYLIKEDNKSIKNEIDSTIKGELEKIKEEIKLIKNKNDFPIKGVLETIKEEIKLIKNENDSSIKGELETIKEEIKLIKNENNSSIKGELDTIKENTYSTKNENNSSIKDELVLIKENTYSTKNETIDYSIKYELEKIKEDIHSIKMDFKKISKLQNNQNLEYMPNYLEYTIIYADFENNGICMYCQSEPYEPIDDILFGPVIDNDIYTNLKNILNN